MAEVKFIIPDEKVNEFLTYFIADQPIPIDADGKPLYTPAQWWKGWVVKNTKQACQRGKNKSEMVKINDDIIQ